MLPTIERTRIGKLKTLEGVVISDLEHNKLHSYRIT